MVKSTEVKKPMNAFFMYRKAVKARIKAELQIDKASQISKVAAKLWKAETEEVKLLYRNRAIAEHNQFVIDNPNFVWPSKKTGKGHKKTSSACSSISSISDLSFDVDLGNLQEDFNLPNWDFSSADAILKDFFDMEL